MAYMNYIACIKYMEKRFLGDEVKHTLDSYSILLLDGHLKLSNAI